MSDATPCEHHQVYNQTWRCTECGEKMISRHDEPQYLLAGSSPNAPRFLEGYEVIYDCEHCTSDQPPVVAKPIEVSI